MHCMGIREAGGEARTQSMLEELTEAFGQPAAAANIVETAARCLRHATVVEIQTALICEWSNQPSRKHHIQIAIVVAFKLSNKSGLAPFTVERFIPKPTA